MGNKLIVAGCSFSDLTSIDQKTRKASAVVPYGELLAQQLSCTYIHEGACSGSNYRIWRVVTNYILDRVITPDDTVIIQYTQPARDEFWSMYTEHPNPKYKWVDFPDYGGTLLRAKAQSQFSVNKPENQAFLKMWEEGYLNEDYMRERYRVYNAMFQGFLLQRGFNNVYWIRNDYNQHTLEVVPEYQDKVFDAIDIATADGNWLLTDHRPGMHLTQQGHQVLAQALEQFIKKANTTEPEPITTPIT
jgi:hypothetical protein